MESGVGINPQAHADSAAEYDSEAGERVRSESGSESEVPKSDSARARNRTRYGVGNRFGVGFDHELRGLCESGS